MNINEKTNIIIQAFLSKIISDEWHELSKDELYHICQYADYNKIPDRSIADNEELHKMIPWNKIDRMKIVRVVARNAKIADFVDLSKYNYAVKEIKNMLKIRPYLIDKINIDLNNIGHEDAFCLLTIGADEISKKVDIKKYNFTSKEIYEIIEYNNFSEDMIRNFDLKKLKDYHICDIIINTGNVFLNILDLKQLTARKWIEILKIRPELINHCDLNKFKQSDIYNSVELICLFKNQDFNFLIKDRKYKEELSALGWEKLIINSPSEYIDLCCYYKLNETNWKRIIEIHPHLIIYKTNYNCLPKNDLI
jgi:hypothetical protein